MVGKLYYEGVDYLMGMLFRECFVLNESLFDNLPTVSNNNSNKTDNNNNTSFSLALHSRHTSIGDTGQYIVEEMTCLSKLLPKQSSPNTCFVYLMSDRILTVQLLSKWIREHNCTPIYFNSSSTGSSSSSSSDAIDSEKTTTITTKSIQRLTEHGSRAGIGFMQDLLSVSRARDSYIGDIHRSSFRLLIEIIEYDRKIEAWRLMNKHGVTTLASNGLSIVQIQNLTYCTLKNRSPMGYNYGPGTPTFKHPSFLEPLVPIAVVNRYKQLHSVGALHQQNNNTHHDDDRQYVIATIIPTSNTSSFIYQFLNSKYIFLIFF
jgi:hypothetical protein